MGRAVRVGRAVVVRISRVVGVGSRLVEAERGLAVPVAGVVRAVAFCLAPSGTRGVPTILETVED